MITLRKLNLDDLDTVHALISNIEVVRYMLFPMGSRDDSEKFLRDSIDESPSDPWRSIVRGVATPTFDEVIGLCGIVNLRGSSDGELWYLVSPTWWRKGVATAAAKAMLTFGFNELRLHRIWATCLPENPGSARVLENVGMRREGHLVKNLRIHGEWRSSYLYAMLEEEWLEFTPASSPDRALAGEV